MYDLIIIGGGAAGIMAAISARTHHKEYKILIIDRTFAIGRKILVSGAGRCNITNLNLNKSNINNIKNHYYSDDENFVKSIFEQFSYEDIINFFEKLGIETYIERKTNIGKVFPITDSAKNVVEILRIELEKLNIELLLNNEVTDISSSESQFTLTTKPIDLSSKMIDELDLPNNYNELNKVSIVNCDNLIIAAGGKSYENLGANGSIYSLLNKLGHTIIHTVPSALPLCSDSKICKLLSGQKTDLKVTSIINGKRIKTTFDDVMFTEYGISGPAILNISREISIELNRLNHNSNCQIAINFLINPDGTNRSKEEFIQRIQNHNSLYQALLGILPIKFCKLFESMFSKINITSVTDIEKVYNQLSNFELNITGTRSFNEAEFTAGGVKVSEIKINTLESKLVSNLYFAGEVIDVDGDVGGYNLSWAWSSGFVAGKTL